MMQSTKTERTVNLLPGPVAIDARVREAFERAPVSHRGAEFMDRVHRLRERLKDLVSARHVELLLGSGTLANDAVAAQLSLRQDPGLILVNGEFGERLVEQATRFGLTFEVLTAEWGDSFDYPELDRQISRLGPGWLWAVHCETSTGVLNDLERLKDICRQRGVDLCLDCISSIGTVPVNLQGVHLATCVSGKGLASYPGVAMVFHHHAIEPQLALPRYLDLGYYAAKGSVPFTTSSNLIHALGRSLELREQDRRLHEERIELACWLRRELVAAGWRLLAPPEISSPAVLTLVLDGQRSMELGEALERQGFLLSYRSEYLESRNLIQIVLMGDSRKEDLERLLGALDGRRRSGG